MELVMQRQAKEIEYFLYGQAFADGLKTTLGILMPALTGFYFDSLDLGMTMSLGAMAVSLTDAPGPIRHKQNGMLISLACIFAVSILTPLLRLNVYLLGLEILLLSFFFSMFSVYGNRATAVGNGAILVMILVMDHPLLQNEVLKHAALILAGGTWYLLISLFFYRIQPYRMAQRILGECIREVATYVRIKSDFYNVSTDLDDNYRRLVTQQIIVNEKQDAVREIMFKTRQIVSESTATGRKLVWAFVETVDLFEDVTATYYDYALLRKRFEHSGVLDEISGIILQLAGELDEIGMAIQTNASYTKPNFEAHLIYLKNRIDAASRAGEENILVLKKILVTLRRLVQRFNELCQYFEKQENEKRRSRLDHSHFVGHTSLDPKVLWNNITGESMVFKHALRVSLACIAGFIITQTFTYGDHSYWILMTIAFILKPAFSLTKQRNIQRIIGTVAGGLIGVLILVFIEDRNVQFIFMVFFMLISYTFMRVNYLVMVIAVTPFVLILFSRLGISFSEVARERVIDTVIGCAIAFAASYFLFPTWESEQLKKHLENMLRANSEYLRKIMDALSGKKISMLEYKLVRKEVYVSSANLSAAFQRMLSEPKSKQKNSRLLHQFVVLNHILYSNIANMATTLLAREPAVHPFLLISGTKRTIHLLECIHAYLNNSEPAVSTQVLKNEKEPEFISQDDNLLKDQLDFIHKITLDIEKTVKQLQPKN